jgi:YggT family protein
MIDVLIPAISYFSQLLVLIVLAHVILSYFMSPYHPVRATIDRLVAPLLDPIRRVIPSIGMLDFSPVILIILVQLVSSGLIKLLATLR